LATAGFLLFKASVVLDKVGKGGIFSSIVKSLPGVEAKLKGEEEGRINILFLGMRGEGVPGGGLLADTIMVFSVRTNAPEGSANTASLISIPRDLYVTVPDSSEKRKVNAVYALGEQKAKGQGSEQMKRIISEITGQTIHYAVVVNFKSFVDVVNAAGGITIHRDEPFSEGLQFREPQVCDPYVYTVPTTPQQYQHKYYTRKDGTRYIAKSYPLCFNKNSECGGVFELPAGDVKLDGNQALCYARSRYGSNDFERAKRQQEVIAAIKDKMLSAGMLIDFSSINSLLDSLGENVRIDMEGWEMKRAFDLYKKVGDSVPLKQKVLDNTEEGLLYTPEMTKETGYILLPRGDNYDRIRDLFSKSLE
jgi:anionic cell wall polymer biosynthesis LytR-Cps2A-Psr (LCP) family protein